MLGFINKIICWNNKETAKHNKMSDIFVSDEEFEREDSDCEVHTFSFISDEEEEDPKEYRVLVLGEAGVGKTAFIRTLKERIAFEPKSFSKSNYVPTKTSCFEYIPETNTDMIVFDSAVEHAINKKYSKEVANFMIRPHLHKEEIFYLMEHRYMGQCNTLERRNVGRIKIVEMPSTTRNLNPNFERQFDKIVIMGDYHDITTLRSMKYWADLINAPKHKIIACVNKCDNPPISIPDDFQYRKERILRYFFENYNLEFMSVRTGANLEFIYKYL